ncbi:hypothetical protein RB597_007753 [Gaeumannomyces tritici]
METTLIPFATLPACAQQCGPLFDANGACVPPAAPTAAPAGYAACFCSNAKVSPFSAAAQGVCGPGVCADNPANLESIRNWFTNFCKDPKTLGTGTGTSNSNPTGTGRLTTSQGGGGDWMSNHWQWVVFLVIMVVGIAGIWIGACIWRRRYLRKKDRQYALGKRLGEAGVGGNGGGATTPGPNGSTRSVHLPAAGMFMPAPISEAGVYGPERGNEKKAKTKWNPTERT